MIDKNKIYTRKETMDILAVSSTTLKRYMKSGKINYFKSGENCTCKVTFTGKNILDFLKRENI